MAAAKRRNFNDIVEYLMYDLLDSSSSDDSDSDDDFDLLLVETAFASKHNLGPHLNLQDISDDECEKMFRFEKHDMHRLLNALEIPENYTCCQGTIVSGIESLMIMLRRLSYPNRWIDLVPIFGRSQSELSLIFNTITDDIYERYNELLTTLDLVWLDPEMFSQVIHAKGSPLTQCWGFIDGTPRAISRPIHNQRIMYSGHKRIHCLKFQSVQAPNGLIAHMFGPIEGRHHDAFMLGVSDLLPKLQRLVKPNGEPYVLYGDPAYGISRNILAPFQGAHLTPEEQEFNKAMSKVRVSVEWGFGKIIQNFGFLDFKKNLKVLLQPVAKYYLVATILTNCHTCLYGSLVSSYFELDPPSLESYLSNT